MIIKIGIISGEIWSLLEKEGKLPFSTLLSKVEKDISVNRDLVCMGIGWLARKGHIVLERENSDYIVYLRKSSSK